MSRAASHKDARLFAGLDWRELDTPCLTIDLDILERNIKLMADFLALHGKHCRPHFKAHMCAGVAEKQMAAGAIGLCAAKVSAAEVLADHGITDILLANQVNVPVKIKRLMALAARSDVKVLADTPENIEQLSAAAVAADVTLGVLVEVRARSDLSTYAKGYTRNGIDTADEALSAAKAIDAAPGLIFKGVMAYEGPHPKVQDPEVRRTAILKDFSVFFEFLEKAERAGLACEIVSAGGTATYHVTGLIDPVTELQPGSYATMNTLKTPLAPDFDQSLHLVTSVVGRPEPETAVLDVGMKSLKMSKQDTTEEDRDRPPAVSVDGLALHHLSEEHAAARLSGEALDLKIADRVMIAPSYGAPTINYHDRIYALRGGVVEDVWRVDARGCSQ
ncbi:MAG: alanine racemase [Pseudomonadota bacterium]